ncbi:MAG: 4-hydroxythreonine-4-phosphate dehydrogenase PdxA [Candidatus Delongbacteria bacterium]|jgi:4-hydroxythreonine-4-phosphate dehydrogenase|nr:4-hydroxythreonine-4-phosphate dehydrogenase PdxA [Candidatus Delongbacteria bacterium]
MNMIYITCGDINGVGNELILRTLSEDLLHSENIFTVIGNEGVFLETAKLLGVNDPQLNIVSDLYDTSNYEKNIINFYSIDIPGIKLNLGKAEKLAGKLSGLAIIEGVKIADHFKGSLVTAPINKYSLHLGGYNYPGHTEFISEILNEDDFLMILDGEIIRVALVTTHLALKDVSDNITTEKIINKGNILYKTLVHDYNIKSPNIVVCSLNPHASDNGLFGTEEKDVIEPAVKILNKNISEGRFVGPMPSDTAFTKDYVDKTDAYLVMYHDQGLIPLKLLSFGSAVNFTAGLSLVRTSPDHGTAYDIVGKGICEVKSFKNALDKAILFFNNRKI